MIDSHMTLAQRHEQGLKRLNEVDGQAGEEVIAALGDIAPQLADYIVGFAFGEVYSRPGLSLREREIATLGALTALGALPQLKVHIRAALNVGLTRDEIIEVLVQMGIYAGFPAALNAVFAAKEVLK
ncbi:MAG: carboxymuconolactone decarboxylase family protein [Asticcacaulis sp.]|nr:carboxymuconolactone decarboxylase family protein [Asticcacaulis sp.]